VKGVSSFSVLQVLTFLHQIFRTVEGAAINAATRITIDFKPHQVQFIKEFAFTTLNLTNKSRGE